MYVERHSVLSFFFDPSFSPSPLMLPLTLNQLNIPTVVVVVNRRVTGTLSVLGVNQPRVASRRARRVMLTNGWSLLGRAIWVGVGTRTQPEEVSGCIVERWGGHHVQYVDQQTFCSLFRLESKRAPGGAYSEAVASASERSPCLGPRTARGT